MLDIKGLVFLELKITSYILGAVSEADALYKIQEIVHQTCLAEGFKLETRPYHPHITFARKWGVNEDFLVDNLSTRNPFKEKPLSFKVNEIVLYKSNIENTPKYEPIASIYLEE